MKAFFTSALLLFSVAASAADVTCESKIESVMKSMTGLRSEVVSVELSSGTLAVRQELQKYIFEMDTESCQVFKVCKANPANDEICFDETF